MAPGNLLDGVQDESLVLGSGLSCLNYDEVNYVCMYVRVFTCVCASQHRKDLCSLTLWVTSICGGWRGKAEGKGSWLQYRVSAAHSASGSHLFISSQHPWFLRLCRSLVALVLRVSEIYPARVIVMECWTWGTLGQDLSSYLAAATNRPVYLPGQM